jgi:hypothetical protein
VPPDHLQFALLGAHRSSIDEVKPEHPAPQASTKRVPRSTGWPRTERMQGSCLRRGRA